MGMIDLRALQAAVRSWLQENIPNDAVLPRRNEDLTPEMEAVSYTHLTLPTIYSV